MAFVLDPVDGFGIVGLVTLLTGFLGNLVGRIASSSRWYAALNAVGSGILAVYAWLKESWVFLPLEIVWALAAGVSWVRGSAQKAGA